MKEFDTLYLSWRVGQSTRRFIVGVIKKDLACNFSFHYIPGEVSKAEVTGFKPYIEFPDTSRVYNGNVVDIFAQRLTKSVRPDIQSFYDFWEIEDGYKQDKFYLLGHTQGLLPTDNFEFLADYKPVEGLRFLTDLAGLSNLQLSTGTLATGDSLTVQLEDDNEHDREAVFVKKTGLKVGYIKKIHCRVFRKAGAERLRVSVKALDTNGIIKRVFVKVWM